MRRTYLFFGSLIILVLGVIAYIFSSPGTPATSPGSSGTNSTTPFGPPTGFVPSTTSSSTALMLRFQDDSEVSVSDFTKENQPPTANAESGYQVAGSNTSDFQILYYPQNSGILISLLAEPLGEVRFAAESALRAKLGLSNTKLCKLVVDVRTTADVNSTFAGRNLGLSFCPGSVTLPK